MPLTITVNVNDIVAVTVSVTVPVTVPVTDPVIDPNTPRARIGEAIPSQRTSLPDWAPLNRKSLQCRRITLCVVFTLINRSFCIPNDISTTSVLADSLS